MDLFADVTTRAAEFALDALALRRRVSANNVANALTPGFHAQRVEFEDSLAAAIAAGDLSPAQVTLRPSTEPANVNGNNVSLDRELAGASGLHYEALVQVLTFKHHLLHSALT